MKEIVLLISLLFPDGELFQSMRIYGTSAPMTLPECIALDRAMKLTLSVEFPGLTIVSECIERSKLGTPS